MSNQTQTQTTVTNIFKFSSIDADELILTKAKKNDKGKVQASLLHNEIKKSFYIETPYLIAPFSPSTYNPNNNVPEVEQNWSLSVKATPGNGDSQENVDKFFDIFRKLEERMIDWALENSLLVFGKTYKPDQKTIIEALLEKKKLIKSSIDKEGNPYPDRIDFKFSRNDNNKPDVLIFRDTSVPLQVNSFAEIVDLIPKGSSVKAIIHPTLYTMPGGCGIRLRIVQIKLSNNSQKLGKPITYAFSDPVDDTKKVELTDDEKNKISSNDDSNIEVSNDEEAYDSEVEVGDEDV
jgi:hypothetical protein